ncbi:MAG: mercuric reductase, partial [Gemmatimonadetes bacterium]|nr:mercuric reductase [Gemmatimonadota bacterium]
MTSLAPAPDLTHPSHADYPALVPFGEANQLLASHVHPAGWENPTPRGRYHLVVIGAGTGGLVTAAAAAGLGAKVALIERHLMGGDCLNVGCVPSKGVIRAARSWAAARESASHFHGPIATGEGDFAAAMERMRRLRARIAPVDGAPRYRDLGVDVFIGNGSFVSRDAVEVAGARLTFRRAVIATGARAAAPPIPGLADAGYLTNETVFSLTQRPQHLLVIGAGPIGCEMAQSFARFGARVTLIDQGPRILPREDADASRVVEASMRASGVEFVGGAAIKAVERQGERRIVHLTVDGQARTLEGDALLVAIGRAPNVEGLGLEVAGVAFDKAGVSVDDQLRTSNPAVYAVGDICSAYKFTHAADFQARTVVQNALFFGRARASRLVIPWATYTSPELAHVGLTEAAAHQAGTAVDTVMVPFHDNDRAILDGEEEGFLKVVLAKGTDRILGATLVAEHAGDMIGEITLAMTAGIGLSRIGQTIHPYPTQGEVFRKAADLWRRRKLTPTVRKLF